MHEILKKLTNKFFSDESNIISGAFGVFNVKIVNALLLLLTSALLARLLEPEKFGIYSYALAIINLLSVPFVNGFPDFIVRETAKYQTNHQSGLIKGLSLRANQIIFLIALLVAIFAFLFSYFFKDNFSSMYLNTLWISLMVLLLTPLVSIRKALLRGLNKIFFSQLPEFILQPLTLALLIITTYLVFNESVFSPEVAMLLRVSAIAVTLIASVILVHYYFPKAVKNATPEFEMQTWLRGGSSFMFLGGLIMINGQLDILILGVFKDAAQVGIYRSVVVISTTVGFFLASVNYILGPMIVKSWANTEMDQLQKNITLGTRIIFFASLPIALFLIFAGDVLLELMYGDKYTPGHNAVAILCFAKLINAGCGAVGMVINMTGNEKYNVFAQWVAMGSNVILNVLLIPRYGIEGAAIATGTSQIIWNVYLVTIAVRKVNIDTTAFGFLRSLRKAL